MCGVGETTGTDWVSQWPYGQDRRKLLRHRIYSDKARTVICNLPTTPIAHTSQPRARAMLFCSLKLLAWRGVLSPLLFLNVFSSSVLLKPVVHNLKFYPHSARVLSKRMQHIDPGVRGKSPCSERISVQSQAVTLISGEAGAHGPILHQPRDNVPDCEQHCSLL